MLESENDRYFRFFETASTIRTREIVYNKGMNKWLIALLAIFLSACFPTQVNAQEILGVHILHPQDLPDVEKLLRTDKNRDQWQYVTIPFTLQDTERVVEWQAFFEECHRKKLIPLVRLATRVEGDSWVKPTKKDVVVMATALGKLNWPTAQRHVMIFNEPNHAKEWGGEIDPEGYAEILQFATDWFHTEKRTYVVLPAGLDLAAPNGRVTMEAFAYWRKVHAAQPEVLASLDAWNSHSYPNPGFSSSPLLNTKSSLRGFQHELQFIKELTGKEYQVYITETGWESNARIAKKLPEYYRYAVKNIWSDPRVVAVTPFLLRGSPGPFDGFSFFNEAGPTIQFTAYRQALDSIVTLETRE